MKYKGFDKYGFIQYLDKEFHGLDDNMFRETIINIIDYAHEHEHVSKDMFCEFVSDMIADVTFGEVAMFIDDDCLTENGQAEKRRWLELNTQKI
jgi:hypothetical protein